MKKLFKFSFALLLVITSLGCKESGPDKNATVYDIALYNKNRPNSDRKLDDKRLPNRFLELAKITKGMRVADLSAGSGYLTEIVSYIVGDEGTVYMQNGPRYVAKHRDKIDKRLKNNRLSNVIELISKNADELNLPNNLDVIILSNTFHDLFVPRQKKSWNADPKKYLSQIFAALKQGGKLIITDHSAAKDSGTTVAKSLHRIEEGAVKKLLLDSGLKFIGDSHIFRNEKDNRQENIFNESIRGDTDRFILLFEK